MTAMPLRYCLGAVLTVVTASWAKAAESAAAEAAATEAATTEAGTVAATDQLLTEELFQHLPAEQPLAPITADQPFLRRVYLDLVGQLPTPGEITAFCLDASPDKRTRLIARLLADERFGRNWGRYWRDVILYRRSADQALIVSGALEKYLVEQFNGRPRWNEMARAFLTAQGEAAEKGETGLFMAHLAAPVEVAAETSRIFLGIQIQCAQCHDHPTDRWKRQQFHEFVAFFPRASIRRRPTQPPSFELTSFDFGPPRRRPMAMTGRGALEHYMPDLKDPTSQGALMTPVFFATAQKLSTGVTDVERRKSLADWLTSPDNPWFARAFVNRVWAEFVGEGFYEPIDDLGPDRQPSAPQTLDYLCREFVAHDHDVKWLLQAILGTSAYQRESRPRRSPDDVPFAANVAYRLRADQLLDSLASATGTSFDRPAGDGSRPGPAFRGGPRFQFARQFGYDPSVRRDEITSTVPQALAMMNSPLVNGAARGGFLGKVVAGSQDDEGVALDLYLRCLAREPSDAELAVCLEYVKAGGNRREAFEDVFWSLVNSEEFLYRN
jgi:hypothetical protein